MNGLMTGFCKQPINPPLETFLAGYEYERHSKGVHDDLYARTIVIKGLELFVIVSLDLVAVDESFVAVLQERLHDRWGIKRENLMVSCTHTHSGPGGTFVDNEFLGKGLKSVFGEYDHTVTEYIIRQIIGCIAECLDNLDHFRIRYAQSHIDGIGLNRRDPAIPIDNELQVLFLERNDGRQAVIYNYACHPTVLDKKNILVSADYPGETSYILEHTGGFDVALFLNGACGDISTRFTRRESTYKEVKRIGSILGGEILKLASQKEEGVEVASLRTLISDLELKVREFPSAETSEMILRSAEEKLKKLSEADSDGARLRLCQSEIEGVKFFINLAGVYQGIKSIKANVSVMKLNELLFAFIPGELFSSLGIKIKRSITDGRVFVVCYSGGYIGYIPDIEAYRSGGYESFSTPLQEGEGERLVDSIIDLLKDGSLDK